MQNSFVYNAKKYIKKLLGIKPSIYDLINDNDGYIGSNNLFAFQEYSIIDPGRLRYIRIGNDNVFSKINIFCHDYSWSIIAQAKKEILPDPGGEVIIGNNNFFGFDTVILGPVRIGSNNIIGTRSLIIKDIGNNEVWAGSPAQKIMSLDDLFRKNKSSARTDIYKYIDIYVENYHEFPKAKDFSWLSIYFLERNEDNYTNYLSTLTFKNENNSSEIKKIFFKTEPYYKSYEDLIESYLLFKEKINE